jgi:beta-fructofuranosidase
VVEDGSMPDAPSTARRHPRPAVHFTSTHGWINDPLGIGYRNGQYEMFFQSVPGSSAWAPQVQWGRATSPDLAHWAQHASALTPDDLEVGCWSGDVVIADGTAEMFYTSVGDPNLDIARIRVAHPRPDQPGLWRAGPVVAEAPAGEDLAIFRDPTVIRHGSRWRMLVGAGRADGTPRVLSYVSDDRSAWAYDGVFASPETHPIDLPSAGQAWECPHIVHVDGYDVLLLSAWDGPMLGEVLAGIGELTDDGWTVHRWQQVTYGDEHYAPTTFLDGDGAPCAIFWLRHAQAADHSWTGALSVPYRLRVEDGVLLLEPHPQVLAVLAPARLVDDVPVPLPSNYWGATTFQAGDGAIRLEGDQESMVRVPPTSRGAVLLVDGPIVEACAGDYVVGLTSRHLTDRATSA